MGECTPKGQKKALEYQAVVSHQVWVLATNLQSFGRAANLLDCDPRHHPHLHPPPHLNFYNNFLHITWSFQIGKTGWPAILLSLLTVLGLQTHTRHFG